MNTVNVHASITNVVQMDRLQTDAHRGPIVNQEQNAEAARRETTLRARAPVQPDKAEGKKTDPDGRREEERRAKRSRKPTVQAPGTPLRMPGAGQSGRVIDFVA